ncbi:MAG: site-2 protease family protein [Pseudomonadota bacterium]
MDIFFNAFTSIVSFILALFIVLSIHEWGHYICAKIFRVSAPEFSLGSGKEIYSKYHDDTLFRVHLIPFGAHVSVNDQKFQTLPSLKKALIILSGPLINILFCFLLLLSFYTFFGKPAVPPVLAGVEIGNAADRAGLKTGDKILKVNGVDIHEYDDVQKFTRKVPVQDLIFTIERNQEILTVNVTPENAQYVDKRGLSQNHGRLGVLIRHEEYKIDIISSINGETIDKDEIEKARKILLNNLDQEITLGLKSVDGKDHDYLTILPSSLNEELLNNTDREEFIASPLGSHFYRNLSAIEAKGLALSQTNDFIIGIIKVPFQLFPLDKERLSPSVTVTNKKTFLINALFDFIFLTALLSVFIALINILPLPHFDGGRLLMLASEKIYRGDLTQAKQAQIFFSMLIIIFLSAGAVNYQKFQEYAQFKYCKLQTNLKDKSSSICH